MSRPANHAFSVTARAAAKYSTSASLAPRRLEVMRHAAGEAVRLAIGMAHPVIDVPANQIVVRMVPHDASYLKDYGSLFRCPPDNCATDPKRSTGAYSTGNRFTGAIDAGKAGLNGAYFGTLDGVAAEDFYYSVFKDLDDSGPRRLMAANGRVVVQRMKEGLNRWEDMEVPQQLIYSGRSNANIIVARTIRKIRSLNLNLRDPVVQQHLKASQPKFQQLLTGLEFSSLAEAIEDAQFRDFARQYAYGACTRMGVEAIWASSVRAEEAGGLDGFDRERAQNLVLLGAGNQPVTDRLVGVAVISVRSDPVAGIQVVAEPIHGKQSRYQSAQSTALMIRPS